MQIAIVAGGLATRLGPSSQNTPKSMIDIVGKPFLERQIELLAAAGVRKIVLCIGHLGAQIREYFGDGQGFGVKLTYSDDGEHFLGTGGALKKAEPLLEDPFLMMWGDSYLLLDYGDVWRSLDDPELDGVMVVYQNDVDRVKNNVAVAERRVVLYDKCASRPEARYVDNGLTVVRKRVLGRVPPGVPYAIERVFAELAADGRLGAYETGQRFYEIGSPEGIHELKAFLSE